MNRLTQLMLAPCRALRRPLPDHFLDDEQRPVLRLHVEATEVLADDSEDEQLRAAQDQHDGHHRRPTPDRDAGDIAMDRVPQEYQSYDRENEAEIGRNAQR